MDKLIITVAGVGAETTKEAQPALPVTAAEIGADAARCREAGASMYHLHVRDAAGSPTQAREVFAAAIEAIRERTDIIIQTSTGGAMGMSADERLQPLELDPEMASLTTGTANFGDDVFFNDTALMTEFYTRMQKQGVRPEFEIFEAGQMDNALKLVKQLGPAGPLLHWDFVLGVPGSMSGEPRNLVFLVDRVPPGSTWTTHRHRPLAHAGHDDGAGPRRQRAPRLRGQRLPAQGRARRRRTPSSSPRRAPGRGSGTGECGHSRRGAPHPQARGVRHRLRQPLFVSSPPPCLSTIFIAGKRVGDPMSRRRAAEYTRGCAAGGTVASEGADGVPSQEPWEIRARRGRAAARPDPPRQPAAVESGARRHRARHRDGPQRDLRLPRSLGLPRRSLLRAIPRARHGRRAPRVRSRVVQAPGAAQDLGRAVPREVPDRLVLLRRPSPARRGPTSSSTTCRSSTSGRAPPGNGIGATTCSCRSTTRSASSWACSTSTTLPTAPSRRSSWSSRSRCSSTHAAVAIENARQYEQLEHTTAALEAQLDLRHAMIEASAALLSTLDERDAARPDRDAAQGDRRLRRDGDPARRRGDAASCTAASPPTPTTSRCNSWRSPLDVGVTGWVLQHNEAQLVNDMLNDPRGALVPGTEWEPQASIIAPLTVGGKAIGVLALDRMGDRNVRRKRARVHRAVRQPRGHRHPERPAVRDARAHVGAAREPARAAAPAAGPEHRPARHARPARRVPRDHLEAQGHGRLRRPGHPAPRRGDARAGVHLPARRPEGSDPRLPLSPSTRASAGGSRGTTRRSS